MTVADATDEEALVYLDHNATTPVLPEVAEAVTRALRDAWGNPSSAHVFGRRARRALEESRERVAALLDCRPSEVVFTSGGTESSNLAIRGIAEASSPDRRRIVTSAIEHPATLEPCRWLAEHGWSVVHLPSDREGRVALDATDEAIDTSTALVSVMHANNETGVMQPVAALAERAHARGAVVHVDAAQSVGKVPVRVAVLGADLLSVAGHKLYAPKGVGALFVRDGLSLRPFALGAGHERGIRPGTENVPGIVGLGVACAIAARDLERESVRVAGLRDRLWSLLGASVPGLALHGGGAERLPNTLSVRFPSVAGSGVLAGAPEVAASTGAACHDGGEHASRVVLAMGVPETEAIGTVRLSLGRSTTADDVDRAARSLARSWTRLRSRTIG